MNKKLLLLAPFALAACGEHAPSAAWKDDCQTYYSRTGRELSVCQKRVETEHTKMALRATAPRGMADVTTDPENATRESETEVGRGPRADGNSGQ